MGFNSPQIVRKSAQSFCKVLLNWLTTPRKYPKINKFCTLFGGIYLSVLKIETFRYVTDQIFSPHQNSISFWMQLIWFMNQPGINGLRFFLFQNPETEREFVFLLSWRDHPQRHRAFLRYRQDHVLHFRAHIPHPRGWWAKNGKIDLHEPHAVSDTKLSRAKLTFLCLRSVFQLPGSRSTLQMFRPSSEPESGIRAFCAWAMWVDTPFAILLSWSLKYVVRLELVNGSGWPLHSWSHDQIWRVSQSGWLLGLHREALCQDGWDRCGFRDHYWFRHREQDATHSHSERPRHHEADQSRGNATTPHV